MGGGSNASRGGLVQVILRKRSVQLKAATSKTTLKRLVFSLNIFYSINTNDIQNTYIIDT